MGKLQDLKITQTDEAWYLISFKFKPEYLALIKGMGCCGSDWKYEKEGNKWYISSCRIKEFIEKVEKKYAISLAKEKESVKSSTGNQSTIQNKRESNIKNETVKVIAFPEIKKKTHIELLDYNNMPDIRKPFAHQLEAADFLLKRKKAILADEMGAGKTFSALIAAYTLPPPRLIISPASVKINWGLEIRTLDKAGSIQILNGKNTFDWKTDWTIINYDILERYSEIIQKINWNSLTVDEAHYIKSVTCTGKPNSKRASNVLDISKNIEYVSLLTGTPMTSRPKDLFNLLKAVGHPCANDWIGYAYAYCGPEQTSRGTTFNGRSNIEGLRRKLEGYMLRRLKKDMLDLPEKIRTFNYVDINLAAYKKELDEYMRSKNYFINISEALLKLTKMKMLIAEQKAAATIEMIKSYLENDEPVVVLTNYTNVINKIDNKYKNECVRLTGESSQRQRQEAVNRFQSGEKKVFLGNMIAAGTGITLTRATNTIINDMDWVPGNHLQAEDRTHRIGQKNACNIIYQVAKGAEIDEIMARLLSNKLATINTIIDGNEGETGEDFGMAAEVIKQMQEMLAS